MDLDDLELDLSTEWDHATRRGKHPQGNYILDSRDGIG